MGKVFQEKNKSSNFTHNDKDNSHKYQKQLTQSRIINIKNFHENNLPWGDDVMTNMEYEGIIFHNINGLKDTHNWSQILTSMKEINVSCFGLAEINTSMDKFGTKNFFGI
jgi:hypothetical protein